MTLNSYLKEYHGGCKASMARAFGRKPQHLTKMFRNPDQWLVVVEDDQHYVCQIRAELIPFLTTGGDTGC